MRLEHVATLQPPPSEPPVVEDRVVALAYGGGDPLRLAMASSSSSSSCARPSILLHDEQGQLRDRFPTKPASKDGTKDGGGYLVQALAFSPDGARLTVAQTDSIVYVYRLGLAWGERKSICNKFPHEGSRGPVTCLAWSGTQPGVVLYGLADGSVVAGHLKSNRAIVLFDGGVSPSYVTALALSGNDAGAAAVASVHHDGSIRIFQLPEKLSPSSSSSSSSSLPLQPPPTLSAQHSCGGALVAAWAQDALVVAGGDHRRITFYSPADGRVLQTFDYAHDGDRHGCRGFTAAAVDPAHGGSRVVLGSFDALYLFQRRPGGGAWEEVGVHVVPCLYAVTSLAWRPDGSQLAVGSLCGGLDLFAVRGAAAAAAAAAAVPAAGQGDGDTKKPGAGADWASTVAQHEARGEWEEAARVAERRGGAEASRRLRFRQARSLDYGRGIQLLQRHGLLEAAVEEALCTGQFDYAIRVCDLSLPRRLADARRQHALHLLGQGRVAEAEELFLQAKLPQEAVDMYLQRGEYAEARRVAEDHHPPALPSVLAAEAAALLQQQQRGEDDDGGAAAREEARRLAQAEQLYLAAGKPEQALQVYVEAGAWAEAFRVAQQHLAHRMDDAVLAYARRHPDKGTAAAAASASTSPETLGDDMLSRVYGRSVDALRRERYLAQLQQAAEVLGRQEQAWAQAWALLDRQRELDVKAAPAAVASDLAPLRERLAYWQVQHLLLGSSKSVLDEALAILQSRAAPSPVAAPAEYLPMYRALVARLLGKTKQEEEEQEEQEEQEGKEQQQQEEEARCSYAGKVHAWRRLLYGVLTAVDARMEGAAKVDLAQDKAAADFRELFLAVHYTNVLLSCSGRSTTVATQAVGCKAAVSLLRYAGSLVPADKAFYLAGTTLRRHGSAADDNDDEAAAASYKHLAFLLLNRYVDLTEAIADRDASLIDPRPLASCSALPGVAALTPLPSQPYIADEAAEEEVRAWVLAACVDPAVAGKALPSPDDEGTASSSSSSIYAGLFACPAAKRCVVTGYPLPPPPAAAGGDKVVVLSPPGGGEGVRGKKKGKGRDGGVAAYRANRADWEAYVKSFGVCPWTGETLR